MWDQVDRTEIDMMVVHRTSTTRHIHHAQNTIRPDKTAFQDDQISIWVHQLLAPNGTIKMKKSFSKSQFGPRRI